MWKNKPECIQTRMSVNQYHGNQGKLWKHCDNATLALLPRILPQTHFLRRTTRIANTSQMIIFHFPKSRQLSKLLFHIFNKVFCEFERCTTFKIATQHTLLSTPRSTNESITKCFDFYWHRTSYSICSENIKTL